MTRHKYKVNKTTDGLKRDLRSVNGHEELMVHISFFPTETGIVIPELRTFEPEPSKALLNANGLDLIENRGDDSQPTWGKYWGGQNPDTWVMALMAVRHEAEKRIQKRAAA